MSRTLEGLLLLTRLIKLMKVFNNGAQVWLNFLSYGRFDALMNEKYVAFELVTILLHLFLLKKVIFAFQISVFFDRVNKFLEPK